MTLTFNLQVNKSPPFPITHEVCFVLETNSDLRIKINNKPIKHYNLQIKEIFSSPVGKKYRKCITNKLVQMGRTAAGFIEWVHK